MLSNNYQNHIEVLRSREAVPSFEEIRKLVLYEKSSRKFMAIPFWMFASAGIPLLLAVSILLFPEIFGLQRMERVDRRSSIVDRQSPIVNRQSSVVGRQTPEVSRQPLVVNQITNHNIAPQLTNHESRIANYDSSITKHESRIMNNESANTNHEPRIKDRDLPITNDERITYHDQNDHRLSLFISGGLPTAQSSLPIVNLFSGSAGVRYRMNSVSTFIFEGRRNAFIRKSTANIAHFRDTTLTLNGATYRNTIGDISSVPVQSVNTIFSIDAGYRFSFMNAGALTPFAEIYLGASSGGGLTSEAAGVEYAFNSPFSFEFVLRGDQFFSPSSSPLSGLTVNTSINFKW